LNEEELMSLKEASKLKKSWGLRKVKFQRHESWRYKRVKPNWRKPKGLDNKMRKSVKGWPKSPNIGHRTPKIIRNLHPSGYKEVTVWSVDDLDGIDSEREAVRVASSVGDRKKVEIARVAEEKGIRLLNPLPAIEKPPEAEAAPEAEAEEEGEVPEPIEESKESETEKT